MGMALRVQVIRRCIVCREFKNNNKVNYKLVFLLASYDGHSKQYQ